MDVLKREVPLYNLTTVWHKPAKRQSLLELILRTQSPKYIGNNGEQIENIICPVWVPSSLPGRQTVPIASLR